MNHLTTTADRQTPPTAAGRALITTIDRLHSALEAVGRRPGEFSISDQRAPRAVERQALEARLAELAGRDQPATEREIGAWLTRLFRGLAHARADVDDAKGVIETYLAVLRGVPLWALREAVLRFLAGSVPRPDSRFAPSSAELRSEALRLAAPFRAERAKIAAILHADVYREPTPEERERVHSRMKALLDELRCAGNVVGPAGETALAPAE